MQKLNSEFFSRDVLVVAPELLGKNLVRRFDNGEIKKFMITEVEAYRGEDDLACHASKGRTARTEVMYWQGGHIYVYLIYGMYYMLNFVTGSVDSPQAILIRGVDKIYGPGKVTRLLDIDKSFNQQNITHSDRIWLENGLIPVSHKTTPRVGIDYAGDYWKNQPWRFVVNL